MWILSFLLNTALAIQVPTLQAPVVDQANVLSADFKTSWNQNLRAVYDTTGVQLALLTIESLKGEAIESASIQIVDEWKLGNKKDDKGVLLLLAVKDRKVRIEVGQGLEGDIPDIRAKQIISDIMIPEFRRGRIETGLNYGLASILQYAGVDFTKLPTPIKSIKKKRSTSNWYNLVFLILLLVFLNRMTFSRRRGTALAASAILLGGSSRGGFGGGGFGGFGGGGGGFSGGGASGSW